MAEEQIQPAMIVLNDCFTSKDGKSHIVLTLVPEKGRWQMDSSEITGPDAQGADSELANFMERNSAVLVDDREFKRLRRKRLNEPIHELDCAS